MYSFLIHFVTSCTKAHCYWKSICVWFQVFWVCGPEARKHNRQRQPPLRWDGPWPASHCHCQLCVQSDDEHPETMICSWAGNDFVFFLSPPEDISLHAFLISFHFFFVSLAPFTVYCMHIMVCVRVHGCVWCLCCYFLGWLWGVCWDWDSGSAEWGCGCVMRVTMRWANASPPERGWQKLNWQRRLCRRKVNLRGKTVRAEIGLLDWSTKDEAVRKNITGESFIL